MPDYSNVRFYAIEKKLRSRYSEQVVQRAMMLLQQGVGAWSPDDLAFMESIRKDNERVNRERIGLGCLVMIVAVVAVVVWKLASH